MSWWGEGVPTLWGLLLEALLNPSYQGLLFLRSPSVTSAVMVWWCSRAVGKIVLWPLAEVQHFMPVHDTHPSDCNDDHQHHRRHHRQQQLQEEEEEGKEGAGCGCAGGGVGSNGGDDCYDWAVHQLRTTANLKWRSSSSFLGTGEGRARVDPTRKKRGRRERYCRQWWGRCVGGWTG